MYYKLAGLAAQKAPTAESLGMCICVCMCVWLYTPNRVLAVLAMQGFQKEKKSYISCPHKSPGKYL